jgi:N-acetylmuramoyl-L-alanine amidase
LALQKQGCLWAINLDGGGSTAFYEKNKSYFTQGRNVPTAFGVKLKASKKKVILDPGHSELVKGKQSPDGTYKEYEFNLDIANRIKNILSGYPCEPLIVDYSHENPSVELSEVVKKINATNGDLLISLHSNAFGTDWNDANGWEIYTYKNAGESRQLAERIHAESKVLGFTDRGIKDGSMFAVIRDTKMPAVLIETGFHTNKSDLAKLKDNAFRDKIAEAYANGILKHIGIEPVRVESAPVNAEKVLYRVQVGAFSSKDNAQRMVDRLKKDGYDAHIVEGIK